MGRRIDIETDHAAQLCSRTRGRSTAELAHAMRLKPTRLPDALTELMLTPAARAIAAPVQCVVSPDGGARRTSSRTARSA